MKSEAKSVDMTNEEIIKSINAKNNISLNYFIYKQVLHLKISSFSFCDLFFIHFIYFSVRCSFTPQKFKRFTAIFSVCFFFLIVTKKRIINKMFSLFLSDHHLLWTLQLDQIPSQPYAFQILGRPLSTKHSYNWVILPG